ncbi:MAG: hypothetical protein ACI8RZ_007738, partial [Myxococcota bacterium]
MISGSRSGLGRLSDLGVGAGGVEVVEVLDAATHGALRSGTGRG